jgi:uncharacterized protein (TIGR03067 family)
MTQSKSLPPRPHLDQLRAQAKTVLAGVKAGDPDAISLLQEHLPAARAFTAQQVEAAGFRLADAQSAIARKSGFASWPSLGRHVEQLRALEGTWEFETLEIDGQTVPPAALGASRLLIDGDRFRMDSPEAEYEGVFNIDVEQSPHHIDIEFVSGPEAGNASCGLFELSGDTLRICLGLTGVSRPVRFATAASSGHALEKLRRASGASPDGVDGGQAARARQPASPVAIEDAGSVTAHEPGGEMEKHSGRWRAVELVLDGKPLPKGMLAVAERSMIGDEVKVVVGGQVMLHARVRIDARTTPMHVEYLHLSGAAAGKHSLGILEWAGEVARFCMAPAGSARPADFTPGAGRTLSGWERLPVK